MSVKLYIVGGSVRDEFLGIESKDIDYAVEASSYDEMKNYLIDYGVEIFQERPQFYSIRGKHKDFGAVDFTLCRKDGFYSDGRRPDDCQIGTIYDDLARRDFTVNAIAKDVQTGEIIDPYNGRKDISTYTLKCVGEAEKRFTEDYLRLLRALRFCIVKEFLLDDSICRCLHNRDIVYGLQKISIERIYEELTKCFEHDTYKTLILLEVYSVIRYVIFDKMGLKLLPKIQKNLTIKNT